MRQRAGDHHTHTYVTYFYIVISDVKSHHHPSSQWIKKPSLKQNTYTTLLDKYTALTFSH